MAKVRDHNPEGGEGDPARPVIFTRHTEVHSARVDLVVMSQERSTGAGSRTWQPKELGVFIFHSNNFFSCFLWSHELLLKLWNSGKP